MSHPRLLVVVLVALALVPGARACATEGECKMRGTGACGPPELGWYADIADIGDPCVLCPPGTYTPTAGAACVAPPAGTVVTYDAAGYVNCSGNYIPSVPPTSCEPCPPGHHANEFHTACDISVVLATSTGTNTLLGAGMFEEMGSTIKTIVFIVCGCALLAFIVPLVIGLTAAKDPGIRNAALEVGKMAAIA